MSSEQRGPSLLADWVVVWMGMERRVEALMSFWAVERLVEGRGLVGIGEVAGGKEGRGRGTLCRIRGWRGGTFLADRRCCGACQWS